FGQKRPVPAKKPALKKPVAAKTSAATAAKPAPKAVLKEIPETEWKLLVAALEAEDWTRASTLASAAIGRLNTDNDKKQLVRLRYFYLYALAGKAAGGKMTYTELEKITALFIGKEFLMPSRDFLSDCTQKVNYICPVIANETVLRVTATNKSGTEIHSFEYVKLGEKFDFAANEGKTAFLGGTLQEAEIKPYKKNISIMRLIFEQGFVNIVASR
ncbi:MAG: hypothetical protein ACR2L1_04530, partial [Pyrinomonadaceae bacterium]